MSGEALPFRFNFGATSAELDLSPGTGKTLKSSSDPPLSCSEISVPIQPPEKARCAFTTVAVDKSRGIHLCKGSIDNSSVPDLTDTPETADSDLIPGKYEGGFKLWECALDLSAHLCQAFDIRATQERWSSALPGNTRVLELGCGHGLPGILLLLAGCKVHFQDYNAEVLQSLTSVNVLENLGSHPGTAILRDERPRYFAGDWGMLPELLDSKGVLGRGYDIILAAETIYSPDSQKQLLQCIKKCLRPGTGQAWIAAKSYYFGVGGGIASFRALVASDGMYNVSTAATFDDGASNKREVLLLTHTEAS
ncbi:g6753 [Coccomyxa viridis]|uniref:protein-histidine N-methyltransferase n=1 Tax=Coccomyxa viridis TaxID=1274662 RepID=A0ABP1FYL8_9CHLO